MSAPQKLELHLDHLEFALLEPIGCIVCVAYAINDRTTIKLGALTSAPRAAT